MKKMTEVDGEVLRLLPEGVLFGVDDVMGKVANARFRLDRLEERGKLKSKVIGVPPDVTKMWMKESK